MRQARNQEVRGNNVDIASGIPAKQVMQAAIDALSAHVAVLDAGGINVRVNRAWQRFGRRNGLKLRNDGIGSSYLAALPQGAGMANLRRRFRQVLNGRAAGFHHAYWCPSRHGARYFEMRISRCGRCKWDRIFVPTHLLRITE